MSKITGIINQYKSVSLKEMDAVQLLNRFDTKYQLPVDMLHSILDSIKNDYFILEHNNERIQKYRSVYFDTENDLFYTNHHNGKLTRLKIRKREYVDSEIAFLELKIKNNKGKTNKLRIPANGIKQCVSSDELKFINKNTGLKNNSSHILSAKSINTFNRITLINKNFKERCTIDINLTCYSDSGKIMFTDMAIIELKQESRNMKSVIADELKTHRIPQQGFSKYCIGRAFLESDLKRNLFKEKLLLLKKQYHITKASSNNKLLTIERKNNDADVKYNFKRTPQTV